MNSDYRYVPDEIPARFWSLIADVGASPDNLRLLLLTMEKDEVVKFYWNYEEAVAQIKPFYYELTTLSEDNIDEICYWVVAQGEHCYRVLWDDFNNVLSKNQSTYTELRSDPGLVSEVIALYREKYHEEIPDKEHDKFVN